MPGGGLSSFSAGAATCSEAEAAEQQPMLIDTVQLRQLLAGGTNPLFVDVRPPEEYAKRRISGAVNVPAGEMPQRWNTLPKNRVIVFYESGQTSGDVCAFGRAAGRILLKHGYPFSQVKVYQDGLAGWEKSALGTAP
jgi:rhodanese-related sulfurtransferase